MDRKEDDETGEVKFESGTLRIEMLQRMKDVFKEINTLNLNKDTTVPERCETKGSMTSKRSQNLKR